jgi:hypothetical protein
MRGTRRPGLCGATGRDAEELGPVYIVVTAATLPILPVPGRVRTRLLRTAQRDAGHQASAATRAKSARPEGFR